MANRTDLQIWILDALSDLDGEASVAEIARHIWDNHEVDLKSSGDLFYTWQYAMRWEGQKLQKAGKIVKNRSPRTWQKR